MHESIVAVCLGFLLLVGCAERHPADSSSMSGVHPTVAWILACRVGGAGFGCYPGDSAFVTRTGMALEALTTLEALHQVEDRTSLIAWLQGTQQKDGGFLEAPDYYRNKFMPWGGMSTLEATYWAVRALQILDAEPSRPDDAVAFIRARQLPSGAFDAYEITWGGAKEATYTTFWAVGALQMLGIPVPNADGIVAWTQGMQDTEMRRGGFQLHADNFPYASARTSSSSWPPGTTGVAFFSSFEGVTSMALSDFFSTLPELLFLAAALSAASFSAASCSAASCSRASTSAWNSASSV